MRGYSIRACRKEDERISLYRRGGCTLSRRTARKINKKKPCRMGGIVSDLSREQNHFGWRPGGVLRSGMAQIGTDGVAGTFGKAGTPNFKSVSRSLAGTGMLPQGRLAGEHVRCTNHFGTPEVVGSHLFLVIGYVFRLDRNHCGSSSIHKCILVSAW